MTVGIIGAMETEVDDLRSRLVDATFAEYAGMRFAEGLLGGCRAVVVRSGVGKVNAAVCAQILIDRFSVGAVINTGVAGSLDPAIDIGDVVVASDLVHHDVDACIFGYSPGEVPQLGSRFFSCDEGLSAILASAAEQVASAESGPSFRVRRGRVATGDQFVSDDARKQLLRTTFQAACCEMEGAAIAQACVLNGVPFLVARCISDKADGSDFMSYGEFESMAARRCAAITCLAAPRVCEAIHG